jgi:hypothetical protein
MKLRCHHVIPYSKRPPIKRTIDNLSEADALEFIRFRKSQLQLLLLHLHIPNIVITVPNRYRFTVSFIYIPRLRSCNGR